jgi:hypothetical protein
MVAYVITFHTHVSLLWMPLDGLFDTLYELVKRRSCAFAWVHNVHAVFVTVHVYMCSTTACSLFTTTAVQYVSALAHLAVIDEYNSAVYRSHAKLSLLL